MRGEGVSPRTARARLALRSQFGTHEDALRAELLLPLFLHHRFSVACCGLSCGMATMVSPSSQRPTKKWHVEDDATKLEKEDTQSATDDRKKAWAAFEQQMAEGLKRQQEQLESVMGEGVPLDSEELLRTLSGLLINLSRSATGAAGDLQDADVDAARRQLKQQQVAHLLKMETTRTAGDVQLTNQKTEMEAVHHRDLEKKLETISSSEGALLAEAHAKQEELQKQVDGMKVSSKSTEDKLMSTTKLLRSAEAKVAKSDEELNAFKAELDNMLKDLDLTKNENQTLGEQIKELVDAFNTAKGELEEARNGSMATDSKIRELEDRAETLFNQLAEAAAEAERASMMHAEECKVLTEQMAGRLRNELERARRGEREAAEEQLNRLLADMRVMGASAAESDEQLDEARRGLAASQAENSTLKETMAKLRKEMAASGAGAAEELLEAKAEIAKLNAEAAAVQAELSNALADLNLKAEENQTLGSQVSQLIEQYEAAKRDIAESKASLESTLSDLNITRTENMTLGEQIKQIVTQLEDARKEISDSKASLETALADLNITRTENMTLGEQIAQLVNQYEEAKNELATSNLKVQNALSEIGMLVDTKRTLSEQLKELLLKFDELRQASMDGMALKRQLADIQRQLDEAMSSVGTLSTDKSNLAEQLKGLLDDYKTAMEEQKKMRGQLTEALSSIGALSSERSQLFDDKSHLSEQLSDFINAYKKARSEMLAAQNAQNSTEEQIRRVQQQSQRERQVLVQTALRSLHEMRNHLTHTASGVRMQQPAADDDDDGTMEFLSWDHPTRWGAKQPKSDMMLIQLRTPAVPPLDVSPKQCLQRPQTSGSPTSANGRSSSGRLAGGAHTSPRVRRDMQRAGQYLAPLSPSRAFSNVNAPFEKEDRSSPPPIAPPMPAHLPRAMVPEPLLQGIASMQ